VRLLAAVGVVVSAVVVDPDERPLPWSVCLVVYFVAWAVAHRLGRPVFDLGASGLDERELGVRDSAAWAGLTVLTALVSVFAVVLVAGDDGGPGMLADLRERAGYVLVGLALVGVAVASWIAGRGLGEGDDDLDD